MPFVKRGRVHFWPRSLTQSKISTEICGICNSRFSLLLVWALPSGVEFVAFFKRLSDATMQSTFSVMIMMLLRTQLHISCMWVSSVLHIWCILIDWSFLSQLRNDHVHPMRRQYDNYWKDQFITHVSTTTYTVLQRPIFHWRHVHITFPSFVQPHAPGKVWFLSWEPIVDCLSPVGIATHLSLTANTTYLLLPMLQEMRQLPFIT